MGDAKTISILGIISLLLLAFLFLNEGNERKNISKAQILSESNFTGYDVNTNIYDVDGYLKYNAKSQEVKFNGVEASYNFIEPKVTLFLYSNPIWSLKSQQALLNKNNNLQLKGDIVAKNLASERKINWIKTDAIDLNLNNYDVKSNAEVVINGMGFNTTGQGITGNLFKQIVNLKQKVKTVYEINTTN